MSKCPLSACQMFARHHLNWWPGFKHWGFFSLCRCSTLSQGGSGVGVPYWRKMQHLLLLFSLGQMPCPTKSFCIQGVSENSEQPLGTREKEETRTWPKVLHLLSTHCLTELHVRERLCFVISLASGLYAVGIFFLSVCFSLASEHQLWSVDRINTKHWETHGGSVYSCMLHVWNSWLCNTGKLYVAAKIQ